MKANSTKKTAVQHIASNVSRPVNTLHVHVLHCVCVHLPRGLNVFALLLQRGFTIREAHSSLGAHRGVKQGKVLGDMFYSPTSQFIFTSPPSSCVCQLWPDCPCLCSPFIVEAMNQYSTAQNKKRCYKGWSYNTSKCRFYLV